MKVLFLAKHLDSGGVTTHMMTLAKGLKDKGCEVALASRGIVGNHLHGPEWFESNGVKHYFVPFPDYKPNIKNIRNLFYSVNALRKVIDDFQPDIIHVHWRATSFFAQIMKFFRNIPFITTLHLDKIPSNALFRVFSYWGERTIAISSETRDFLVKNFKLNEETVKVIYNGVDDNYFRIPSQLERNMARRQLDIDNDTKVVSLIGRLEKVKGHDVLIKALSILKEKYKNKIVALFAGEGSQYHSILQLAKQYNVNDMIRMIGYQDSQKVYWASDVLVLPSRKEGFPLAIVEAMLSGVVPIRTPAAGAYDQIEDGKTGFIIGFDDYKMLANRLDQLLSDDKFREKIAINAYNFAKENFTADIMVEKTFNVYRDVLRN